MSIGVQVTITVDVGTSPEQLDQAFHQLSRMLAAATPPPVVPAPPAPGESSEVRDRVRAAVLDAPEDVTPAELADSIKAAAADSPKIDFSDHKPITSGSQKRKWTITRDELDAMPQVVLDRLTTLQRETIDLVADGLTHAQIAALTGRGPSSVYACVRAACEKLALPLDAPVTRRDRPRKLPPIVNEGTVHCPLCGTNRTALHVEQHRIENEREQARQEAGRRSVAKLSKPTGVGGAA
jgi:DNA-binding NarL/FixJ family response regulator